MRLPKVNTGIVRTLVNGTEKRSVPAVMASGRSFANSFARMSFTGSFVTEDLALGIVPIYSAIKLISESVCSLPCNVYRTDADGNNELASDSPLYTLVHDEANPELPAGELWEVVTTQMLIHGNAYLMKQRNEAGIVTELWPYPTPQGVEVKRVNGRKQYHFTPLGGQPTTLDDQSVLHIRGWGTDGMIGKSTLITMNQRIAVMLAMQEYIGRFYQNGALHSGILKVAGDASDETMQRVLEDWDGKAGVTWAGSTRVISSGDDYITVESPLKDQEFIEQQRFSVQDVARMFNLPPWTLGEGGDGLTYATVEGQAQHFVTFTLRNWVSRIERAIRHDGDLGADDSLSLCFEMDDLLRADMKDRYTAYALLLKAGALTPNDVRREENLNPVVGGDDLIPSTPAAQTGEALAEQDTTPNDAADKLLGAAT